LYIIIVSQSLADAKIGKAHFVEEMFKASKVAPTNNKATSLTAVST